MQDEIVRPFDAGKQRFEFVAAAAAEDERRARTAPAFERIAETVDRAGGREQRAAEDAIVG